MSTIPEDMMKELSEAFALYCIYNPESDHFDKKNEGKISTKYLGSVVRAVGQCPTSQDLEKLEAAVGGDFFNKAQAIKAVETMLSLPQDSAADICEAYRVMSEKEENPETLIDKDMLAQKIKRRLVTDYLTDQYIADAQPDGQNINYKDFVDRQYAVRNLSLKPKAPPKEPAVADVKKMLTEKYGNEAGPAYPYPFKTNKELFDELGGQGKDTRHYLDFGKEQMGVLTEAIDSEVSAGLVDQKIKELQDTEKLQETAVILRELEASYTGYRKVAELQAVSLKVTTAEYPDDEQGTKDAEMAKKLEKQRQRILKKWGEYTKGY